MNKIQKTISFFVAIALMASLFSYKSLEHGYKIGDEATDFELKNIDGNMVSLGQMKYSSAKGFILVFTCNHCPFAQKYEDKTQTKYSFSNKHFKKKYKNLYNHQVNLFY